MKTLFSLFLIVPFLSAEAAIEGLGRIRSFVDYEVEKCDDAPGYLAKFVRGKATVETESGEKAYLVYEDKYGVETTLPDDKQCNSAKKALFKGTFLNFYKKIDEIGQIEIEEKAGNLICYKKHLSYAAFPDSSNIRNWWSGKTVVTCP